MQLNRLTLTQFRAFEQATFDFRPGMNLLVGINGVGKSSALDALRVILSQALPKFTASRTKPLSFDKNDITQGCSTLTSKLEFEVENVTLTYFIQQYREKYGDSVVPLSEEKLEQLDRRDRIRERREQQEAYNLAEQNKFIPDEKSIPTQLKTAKSQPIVVYYSTRRALYSMSAPSKQFVAGGQTVAFADALKGDRELRPREFAEWWLVQEVLIKEGRTEAQRYLDTFENLVKYFLNTCSNLRAVREPQVTLMMDKLGVPLDVRQLSDGERGILALVLDLARRLSWANPRLEDPLQDGKAVVLIDELDLHLHPIWQRAIVDKLTRTFPKCQFIATTHSPQIVGEVLPESIIILENNHPPYRPAQSLGMDSNWVLQFLMGTVDRNDQVSRELDRISELIENEEYDQAEVEINQLRDQIGDFPDLVKLQTRLDRLQLLGM